MKAPLAFLTLAACLFVSCEKSEKVAAPDSTSSIKSKAAERDDASPTAAKPAQGANAPTTGHRAGPEASPTNTLTPGHRIAEYESHGTAGVPKDIADAIIDKAARATTPEEKALFITEQTESWRHINGFNDSVNDIPDHMKTVLLEKLREKHGDSWKAMADELNEQVAASAKVMEYRLKGIPGNPGMSAEEANNFLILQLEKHAPDYKTILSIANQSTRK